MASGRDEGPVYYREIQKNAYLKRIPNDVGTSKLRPLGHKKPPLKPMWTLFCVHNGRTPFLEQYPEVDSPATLAHRPLWRACLRTARHVTASVKPHVGDEYDFLVDTDHGPVRMLAPDWDSMQDWVTILRSKLHELKILSRGENVYGAPPVAPPPRAPARDPTSPLPPTPPVPLDRVPGIEIAPSRPIEPPVNEAIRDIATTITPLVIPTTSTTSSSLSNLRANGPSNFIEPQEIDISQWDVPFSSLPSTSQDKRDQKSVAKICGQNICLDDSILKRNITDSDEEFFNEIDSNDEGYKQRVLVNNSDESSHNEQNTSQRSNVTVIQVSNKGPPHTAIPVIGTEVDVFDFSFKQKLKVTPEDSDFINIVNTETLVVNDNNHIEVSPESNELEITENNHTSNSEISHVNHNGNHRLEISSASSENTPRGNQEQYGTVFENNSDYGHISLTTTVNLNVEPKNSDGVYERLCMASTSNKTASPLSIRRIISIDKARKSSLPNLEVAAESAYECLFPNAEASRPTEPIELSRNPSNPVSSNVRTIMSNVERSQSQNQYDVTPGRREMIVRVQNNSPKRDKSEKPDTAVQQKPIWKRGLTELSLLSRLRGIGQTKRQESPTRQTADDRSAASPAKVVHRSRPVNRVDSGRRRSTSLTNTPASPPGALRVRQTAALRSEQRRGACLAGAVSPRDPPVLCDYEQRVWVAQWGNCNRAGGRPGDRLVALAATTPTSAQHANTLLKSARKPRVDVLFHRIPLGKIYLVNKKDSEGLGIKIDSECSVVSIEAGSPAARAGIPPPGKWAVTEVNNRPINLIKGGQDELNRLGMHGTEVSVVLQPSALVKKMRTAIKANKTLLVFR